METLDYNRLLLVSLWQYNHHGDEGLTPALFEETFGKVYGSHCYEKWTGYFNQNLWDMIAYDLESLTLLNRHEGCACSIKECDVEKVNRLISRMREDRERVSLPTAGDVVTYTTRGGDYYPQAHIERGDDREVHICLLPQTPFCHENEKCTGYNTEGGPWVITGPELLLPDGIRSKQFRMWGHTGRHRNGAVLFHTFVRAWKYTEPDPLYGKYTTKEWTRYIIECQPDIEPADAFIYRNESFTLYSREELERLVGILHGELFNGFRPGLFILWAYRMEWKELPTWEWNMLKAETHLFFLGVSPVKIRTDHNGHTVTFYKKTEQYDTL